MENPKKQGELCVLCILWRSLIQYPVSQPCLHHTPIVKLRVITGRSTVVFGGDQCRYKSNEVQASIYRYFLQLAALQVLIIDPKIQGKQITNSIAWWYGGLILRIDMC